ncbi:MAG: tail fiber domain-containing protein [Flavobacteriales bacterium]|nr:tail fiber domain-containing protein [Flavobacteriales bacterium]
MRALALLVLAACVASVTAQNIGINGTGASPAPSALLDIDASGMAAKGGLLIPRMTTGERNAIAAPAISLLIYNTTNGRFEFHDGLAWVALAGAGTLDQAYDSGGAGVGRVISADAGAVTILGTDGLVSSGGSIGNGALAPTGTGTRLVWNPRKGAFRAGFASGTSWDDTNIGTHSFATGSGTRASGIQSAAFGSSSIASGNNALALGISSSATGGGSFATGSNTLASNDITTALGFHTTASGLYATSMGYFTVATGDVSTAAGISNTAPSYGEIVLGIGATSYTPSVGGAGSFGTVNSLDRLLVVGNAIDANGNGNVDAAERSDALVIRKNGNTGIGTSTPGAKLHVRFTPPNNNIDPTLRLEAAQVGSAANVTFENSITANSASLGMLAGGDFGLHMGCNFGGCVIGTEAFRVKPNGNFGIGTTNAAERLHVVGSIRMVDGNQAANRVMVSDANGTASWQTLNTATTNAWSLTGNAGTSAITNFIGTTDNQMLRFRTNNSEVLRLTANGRAEIGGAPIPALFATGSSKLLVASEVNGEENLTIWAAHNTATGRATLALARQRGSFSLFNNVLNGDGLGEVVFSGYASTSTHVPAASIHCDVDGAPNLLSVPGKLAFSTSPVGAGAPIERMTIRNDGAVGIGTTTPDQHTEIEGTGDQYLRVTSTNAVVAGVEFKRSGAGFSDWQVRNDGGLLLFGQSADELATVTDVLRLGGGSVTPATDNAITCGQAALRWTNVFAVNGTINTSDAREKQDVRALNYGLAEVMQLKPVRFRWKNDPAQGDKLGLIAQDLQGVLPETVVDKSWRVNDDGTREEVPAERLGVYYSDLIPVLIKAIQEQQQHIDRLEERLQELGGGR